MNWMDLVPTDGMLPPAVPLYTADGLPVGAVRARMSGALISKFPCPKLQGNSFAPLGVMNFLQADRKVVLAAADVADGGGVPATALERSRFTDHLKSQNEVLAFDLFVRHALADATPYSPRGKASVIIDLISRGDDVVNRLNQLMFGYQRSRRTFVASPFPSPLR